jgi:hypothetical protein
MAREPIVWRVLLSSKEWDQKKFEEECAVNPAMKRLPQSKGRCPMVEYPWKGDGVIFVFQNKVVMSGIVEQNGFLEGPDHQEHTCNVGLRREHAVPSQFTWIQITELGLSLDTGHVGKFPWKGQRTWVKVAE